MRFAFTARMSTPAIDIRRVFYGGTCRAAVFAVARCRTTANRMSALLYGIGSHFQILSS
jgi:hypothetical protein